MIVITDILYEPFDEGSKIATQNLVECLKNVHRFHVVAINANSEWPFVDEYFTLNRLLFSLSFYRSIRKKKDSKILYIPEASITLFSFIRAKFLKVITGSDISILSLQPRTYNLFKKIIIKAISPNCVFTQSRNYAQYLSTLNINSRTLPLGVNDKKYYEYDSSRKKELRDQFDIAHEKIVLLHVGHIQKSRNLEWLIYVKKLLPELEVLIVGSTFKQNDENILGTLHQKGIKVIREYIPIMEDIYNLADYYVFPVLESYGAIETPLSVLEAMACNLPIITTNFGSLPDVFHEDECFRYVKSGEDIVKILKRGKLDFCNNREKIRLHTWKQIAQRLVDIIYYENKEMN